MRFPHRGQILKETLNAFGLKTNAVAKAVGVNRVTLYTWFKDPELGIDKIRRISHSLKIDLSQSFPEFLVVNDPSNSSLYSNSVEKVQPDFERQLLDLYKRYTLLLEEHQELIRKHNSLLEKLKGN
ncbi:MAG: helix-turn-helix domain-containing protein [Bacteroidia bacterium]|nr:helix-turn-helix domain-containing protein [Bacteroidia bacterium]